MRVEFLCFEDCANHVEARNLLREVLAEKGVRDPIVDVDVAGPQLAEQHFFPGSPTIRVDGQDVEPGFEDPGDYTLRCRVYVTDAGLSGVPLRRWIEDAVEAAQR